MKPGAGKRKGSAFERECCVKLSLWLSDGKVEDVLWRSASSGGRSTVALAKGKRLSAQAGDISCIHPLGARFIEKFFPECKDYADLNFVGLITGKGNLAAFWNEAKTQALNYEKWPILIAKQNRQPTIICLPWEGVVHLGLTEQVILDHYVLGMRIVLFDDLLKHAQKP